MKKLIDLPVFIVDDDPFWAQILEHMLDRMGFLHIHSFEEGGDCLHHLHLNPGLVFLDYQMENSNGLDVLRGLKNSNPGIEVVFCTAFENLEVAIAAMEFGSAEYLLKSKVTEKHIEDLLLKFQKSLVA